jgi:hypothetical protein
VFCGSGFSVLTLSAAQTLLSRYVGANLSFATRISLVTERLCKSGNWRQTKQRVKIAAYPDSNGAPIITLPAGLNTILAADFLGPCGGGQPVPMRNGWYEFLEDGPGLTGFTGDSFIPIDFTSEGLRRYKAPMCKLWTADAPGYFICICKRSWVAVVNPDDEVYPSNIGALNHGLRALNKEDAEDYARADELWAMAEKLLTNEVNDDDGAASEGYLQVEDSFAMAQLGDSYFGG